MPFLNGRVSYSRLRIYGNTAGLNPETLLETLQAMPNYESYVPRAELQK